MPHTYGPLRYRDLDTKQQVTHTCGCMNYISGDIGYCPLHAAAPDLLEACKALMYRYEPADMDEDDSAYGAIVLARAAINKAGG